VDVFKTSRPWFGKNGVEVPLGPRGGLAFAREAAETLMVRELQGHYPQGTYVATYEGSGKVEMSRYDVRRVVREAKGRIEADVTPGDGGVQLIVRESDPADPVRNFRVFMPGFETAKSPFHPLFLERLEPFGVLRFMDWQRINNSRARRWSERASPTEPSYTTEKGAPIEVMIELANTRKSPPWFCIPHEANDEYVREFAAGQVQLDPGLKVYIEYSNEVWNGQFAQSCWAGAGSGSSSATRPLSGSTRCSVEVFAIWEGSRRHRTAVRVLGSQFANPGSARRCWRATHWHRPAGRCPVLWVQLRRSEDGGPRGWR
jgi:hypothetical protein